MNTVSGEDFSVKLKADLIGTRMKTHVYNIYRQYSELKHLKKNLGKNYVNLSVDFSKKYENKQLHEIQSAYFGHECFTIFTTACYVHKDVECNDKVKYASFIFQIKKLKPMPMEESKDGKWVSVYYEDEKFIAIVVGEPINGQV